MAEKSTGDIWEDLRNSMSPDHPYNSPDQPLPDNTFEEDLAEERKWAREHGPGSGWTADRRSP